MNTFKVRDLSFSTKEEAKKFVESNFQEKHHPMAVNPNLIRRVDMIDDGVFGLQPKETDAAFFDGSAWVELETQ